MDRRIIVTSIFVFSFNILIAGNLGAQTTSLLCGEEKFVDGGEITVKVKHPCGVRPGGVIFTSDCINFALKVSADIICSPPPTCRTQCRPTTYLDGNGNSLQFADFSVSLLSYDNTSNGYNNSDLQVCVAFCKVKYPDYYARCGKCEVDQGVSCR